MSTIEAIEAKAREMLRSGAHDKMEVYYLVEALFTELSASLNLRSSRDAAKRGAWNVELLDSAVDDIIDRLGGSYEVLDLWESAWELRTGSGDAKATLEKLLNVIELVKRKGKRLARASGRKR